jgi:phage gp29-like protein
LASKSDSSLFLLKSAGVRLLPLVYVNNIILTGSSTAALVGLIRTLSYDFSIKDLIVLSFCFYFFIFILRWKLQKLHIVFTLSAEVYF